jgi:hypothetical protein
MGRQYLSFSDKCRVAKLFHRNIKESEAPNELSSATATITLET